MLSFSRELWFQKIEILLRREGNCDGLVSIRVWRFLEVQKIILLGPLHSQITDCTRSGPRPADPSHDETALWAASLEGPAIRVFSFENGRF